LDVKAQLLWRLSVVTHPDAEEAVKELLEAAVQAPTDSYLNCKTGRVTVSAYFENRRTWSLTQRARVKAGLERVHSCGLETAPAQLMVRPVRREDWSESWKRHFQPLEVGPTLLVRPSWSRLKPRKGQRLVVIDPGLSFGTGQHPTTMFCLRQLAAHRRPIERQTFLDIGTGSGILAIAAAKLGYDRIAALEIDPEALRVARANARLNGVFAKIKFRQQDLAALSRQTARKYSVICANLVSNLLLQNCRSLTARVRPNGILVLAGILKNEFAEIQRAYEAQGLRLAASRVEREWRSGAFRKPPGP
jgi:ribosomal protein L11 methyltransferase